jgi:hypothetical protein
MLRNNALRQVILRNVLMFALLLKATHCYLGAVSRDTALEVQRTEQ